MNSLCRTGRILSFPAALRPILAARLYSTGSVNVANNTGPKPRKKQVTAFNDDGSVPWNYLSRREKAARTTQQTFNFTLIAVGAVLAAGVTYLMYVEVFSPESKTAYFNRAFDQVRKDSRCTELLGPAKKIRAFGEPTWNSWRRARPIASTVTEDKTGTEHINMHFNVEGPKSRGVVRLHMIKRPSDDEFLYRYLTLDVEGHPKLYLENADTDPNNPAKNKSRMFGISWR